MSMLSNFPGVLKIAEVVTVYNKDDPLGKKNYRPVSIWLCSSKVFEGFILTILDQVDSALSHTFSNHLSGFRKRHTCQVFC